MLRTVVIAAFACASVGACGTVASGGEPVARPTPAAPETRPATPVPATVVAPEPEPADPPRTTPAVPAPRPLALPYGWESLAPAAFETALARWNPGGAPGRLDEEALVQLSLALDGAVPRALRAVLLLARSSDPAADGALLARIERRVRPATDVFPAVDVAAAAALAEGASGTPETALALDELARGRRPHPLLAVRVECAAASVALGRDAASVLLFAVLREGTPAQERKPGFVRGATSIEDLAFAQWRASEALARRAGVANDYRPEASAIERARVAAELERAVAARTLGGGT